MANLANERKFMHIPLFFFSHIYIHIFYIIILLFIIIILLLTLLPLYKTYLKIRNYICLFTIIIYNIRRWLKIDFALSSVYLQERKSKYWRRC